MATLDNDLHMLHSSMKGIGTDEKMLSKILAHRTDAQLQEVSNAYQQKYSRTLLSHIESETR
jgi:uncharacterized protein (UPF0335 family)